MRSLIVVLALFISSSLFAQEYSKWNVGLNMSSTFNGILLAPSINYDLSNKVEIGFMPIYRYYRLKESISDYREEYYGVQLAGKYFLYKENKMDPYISGIMGYTKQKSSSTSGTNYYDYLTIGFLLGNELQLGEKGWFFDFNVGLISTSLLENQDFGMFPVYTLGVKKRFLKK